MDAALYGDDELGGTGGIGGLNALFVLNAPPDTFNLPARPRLPRANIKPAATATSIAALLFAAVGSLIFRAHRR